MSGEYLVLRTADDLGGVPQRIIRQEPARDGQITHLVIEHGDGCGRLLDELCQLGLVLGKPHRAAGRGRAYYTG
jgi:hypothetical protein